MPDYPTTIHDLFGDKYDLQKYEDMFPSYDPTKEQFFKQQYDIGLRGLQGRERSLGLQYQLGAQNSRLGLRNILSKQRGTFGQTGFAGSGAFERMMGQITGRARNQFGNLRGNYLLGLSNLALQREGLNTQLNQNIYTAHKDWENQMYERLANLISSDADISTNNEGDNTPSPSPPGAPSHPTAGQIYAVTQGNYRVTYQWDGTQWNMIDHERAGACWVAEELYGVNDIRTHLARQYVCKHDSWFTRLYRKYGKRWAELIKDRPLLQKMIKPIWDNMWIKEFLQWQMN